MSPGYSRQLRASAQILTDRMRRSPTPSAPWRIADIGCGSGISTQALLDVIGSRNSLFTISASDGSRGMIDVARTKKWPANVSFTHSRAEDLTGNDGAFDGIFAAYLLRNLEGRDDFLDRARRMLAPGGVIVIHDYGVAGRPVDIAAWTALSWGVIIPLATAVTRRPQLFTYLWRSVLDFDSDPQLRDRLTGAGFHEVGQSPAPGWQRGMVRTTWGHRT